MDQHTREDLVRYRINRSFETIKEAQLLFDNGFHSACISRLYYASFYAAQALMIMEGLTPNTHAGVKQSLAKEFVRTGRLSQEQGRYYSMIFEKRHDNDYDDFIAVTKEQAKNLLSEGCAFVEAVRDIIREAPYSFDL